MTDTNQATSADTQALLVRAIATGTAVIAAVRPDQMSDPTPCTEMDVRTLLTHLVGVVDRITALGAGEDPFAVVEAPAPDDRFANAWTQAAERATLAWKTPGVLEQPMALPWVQGTGADVLQSYFCELTVHTWDLATATGQHPEWDEDVVSAALDARDFLPAENRLELYEQIAASMGSDEVPVPFAEAVATEDGASLIGQLVAWTGRNPAS